MIVGRRAGVTDLNMELLLGSMVTRDLSLLADAIGIVLYLFFAGLIACLYAVGFVHVTQRASWALGLLFSLVHVGMMGLVMDALGDIHPLLIRPPLPLLEGHLLAPGLFAVNFGATTVLGFIALHFAYGALVGGMFQAAPRRRLVPVLT
jgi:hypothetical protein